MSDIKRTHILWGLVALILWAFAVHLPVYHNYFYLDDYKQIEFIFPFRQTPELLFRVFSPFWIGWYYRPVQHIIMLLNLWLFGNQALGYYLFSLGLHCLNIALLYRFARIWGVTRWGSWVAVALFAVHQVHQDVLGWISSVSVVIAITFALLSLISYSHYLSQRQPSAWWLLFTLITAILGLLSREENLILPGVLGAIWFFHPRRSVIRWPEGVALTGLLSFWGVYLVYQQIRPTWTGGSSNLSLSLWLTSLQESQPFYFGLNLLQSLLPVWPRSVPVSVVTLLLAGGIWLGIGGWTWHRGRACTRFALFWATLSLLFLYLVIWVDGPDSLPLRYQAFPWLALCLALGSSVPSWFALSPFKRYSLLFLLTGLLLLQTQVIRQQQKLIVPGLLEVENARVQLMTFVPEVTQETHFFATNFPPLADYVQAMATTWYQNKFSPPGGYIDRLKRHGLATPDFYLWHYENGQLMNLMPELLEAAETIFVWSETPTATIRLDDGSIKPLADGSYQLGQVIGPDGARRFGVFLHAQDGGWADLAYPINVPADAQFQVGLWRASGAVPGEDGMWFRVQVEQANGRVNRLDEIWLDVNAAAWQELAYPLAAYAGQTITIHLAVHPGGNLLHDHGYWANPRLTIGTNP